MKYSEVINEGRDAPLYHGTSILRASKILEFNSIEPNTTQEVSVNHKEYEGVSLTRSLSTSKVFGPIIFVLDQRKLSQTNKIFPFDYWHKESKLFGKQTRERDVYEYEEFCVGAIRPLSKYLLKIYGCYSNNFLSVLAPYNMELLEEIQKHPLYEYKGNNS